MAADSAQKAFEARAKAEAAEYSTFRAKVPIYHEGYVAYQPGMPVPASNVELYKYDEQGLVERLTGDDRVQAKQAVPATSVTGPAGPAE